MTGSDNIHATGLVLDKHGVLLRGPSGSGKSLLTLELMSLWTARGRKALLVSDDRVDIAADKGHVVMRAPPSIAGLIELRGRGIVSRPHVPEARLHLVIDLVDSYERMVEEDALVTEIAGVRIPRAPVPKRGLVDPAHQLLLVEEALLALPAPAPRQKRA